MTSLAEIGWPLLGGALIGLAALMLLVLNGRVMGVSGIWSNLVRSPAESGWRIAFVIGALAAPPLLALAGRPGTAVIAASAPAVILAGLLVGFGTALGSGCTSGHGICGISRLSPRSLLATGIFIVTAVLTVFVTRHVI